MKFIRKAVFRVEVRNRIGGERGPATEGTAVRAIDLMQPRIGADAPAEGILGGVGATVQTHMATHHT